MPGEMSGVSRYSKKAFQKRSLLLGADCASPLTKVMHSRLHSPPPVPLPDIPSNYLFTMFADAAMRGPDRASIQRIAARTLQIKSVTVERFQGAIFRVFKLQPSTDFFYILRCRPSSSMRLLRHEEDRLQTEASVLQHLRGRADVSIPHLIDYHTSASPIGSIYLISGPFKGVVLSDIETQLSPSALASIDRSLGQYFRRLTHVLGPSFGALRRAETGSGTWSRCFASMLESILRDAEDALVSLPYEVIRDQVRRHRASLDQITQPKLVLLEMVNDQNILVDTNTWTVSGLLDFATAIWGDPFLSDCFYNPSVGFVEGFGKLLNSSTDERIRQYL